MREASVTTGSDPTTSLLVAAVEQDGGLRSLAPSREVKVTRTRGACTEQITDAVAEETPVSLVYHSIPQVVMMATPADFEDLAVGFTVTENIAGSDEIQAVQTQQVQDGVQVDIAISAERFSSLLRRQRNLTGRTGCGVCGVETIDQAMRTPKAIGADVCISGSQLHDALDQLAARQSLNRSVGSVHAAAWATASDGVRIVREDVGRHNALDKVVGALLRAKVDPATGFLLITSRASYEMVLKAAMVGVSVLVAVSAPTALAIRLAEQCGMTLVGFARDDQHVLYAHPRRVRS